MVWQPFEAYLESIFEEFGFDELLTSPLLEAAATDCQATVWSA